MSLFNVFQLLVIIANIAGIAYIGVQFLDKSYLAFLKRKDHK